MAARRGGTSASNRASKYVLQRDNYQCRIKGPWCIGVASEAHHIIGPETGTDPAYMIASCRPCNRRTGDPHRHGDPPHRPSSTSWGHENG